MEIPTNNVKKRGIIILGLYSVFSAVLQSVFVYSYEISMEKMQKHANNIINAQ